jgi:hypothetical protein
MTTTEAKGNKTNKQTVSLIKSKNNKKFMAVVVL